MVAMSAVLALMSCEKDDELTDGTGKSVNLNRDLVLHYTFDEQSSTTVKDYSSSNITGIIDGITSYVSDTPSGRGYALKLRQNAFVNIPSYPLNDSTNVSVSMWVKDFGQGILVSSFNSSNNLTTPTVYVSTDNKISYCHGNGLYNSGKMSLSVDNYQASGWHHVAVTSTRTLRTVNLYVDGRLVDTFSAEQNRCAGTKMQIGGDGNGEVVTDPMIVDNVRIYKRCLNPSEVTAIYNAERK